MITRGDRYTQYTEAKEVEEDLIGDLSLKDMFLHLEGDFRELSKYAEGLKWEIPEETALDLRIDQIRESAETVSGYYRERADRMVADCKIRDRMDTPGYETIHILQTFPPDIIDQLKEDLSPKGKESPLYGTASYAIEETAKLIRDMDISEMEEGGLFPEAPSLVSRQDYILQNCVFAVSIIQLTKSLNKEIAEVRDHLSPVLRKKYTEMDKTTGIVLEQMDRYIRHSQRVDMTLEEAKGKYYGFQDLLSALGDLEKEKDIDYRIEIRNGKPVVIEYKSAQVDPEKSPALSELAKLAREPRSGQIQVSKDLWESQIHSAGDVSVLGSEKDREVIQKLQKRGKLLFGSLEGLTGGSAYFKSFTIAIAQTLNEQSKYYKTEEDWSGVPKTLITEILGEDVKVKGELTNIGGEQRPFPYILVSYEDLAKKMSKSGKISGGKDIDFIKKYINGGEEEYTDPDTGKKKKRYIPGIKDKKYPISTGNGTFIYVPYIVNEAEIVDSNRKDPEVGCILRLSPLFSKGVRKYTGLRSDTLQLLGGGKQKDITMDLLDLLIYNRGIPGGIYRVRKEELISRYIDKPNYRNNKGAIRRSKLEADFMEAVNKSMEAKVITKYKEERNPGGEILSVFTFNPEYLKGEEVSGPEEQSGE